MARGTPRISVAIEYSPPIRLAGGEWQIGVWAIVQEGRDPLAGETVEFFANGMKTGEAVTGDDGRTPSFNDIMSPSGAIGITVEAQLEREPSHRAKKIVSFTAAAPKAADQWSVHADGKDGEYAVIVSVTSQDKRGLGGVRIEVYDPKSRSLDSITNLPIPLSSGETDVRGRVAVSLPKFDQRFKEFRVEAAETQLEPRVLRLPGPSRRRASIKVPPVPEDDIKTLNPFKVIWRAMRAYRVARESQRQGGNR